MVVVKRGMGQYFIIVNLDKKEYIDPAKIEEGAKFWELCANNIGRLLVYLLRKSSETGGGDVDDPTKLKYCGRWAGDRIVVVGDYDESNLYFTAEDEYKDITIASAREFNRFIGNDDLKFEIVRFDKGRIIRIKL